MEAWAHCEPCGRWFHCPGWFDRRQPQPMCPDCGAEPLRMRTTDPGQQAEAR